MLESSCTSVPAPGICLVDTFRIAKLFVTERVSKFTQSQCGSHLFFSVCCSLMIVMYLWNGIVSVCVTPQMHEQTHAHTCACVCSCMCGVGGFVKLQVVVCAICVWTSSVVLTAWCLCVQDDTLKQQMNSFLLSAQSQQEIGSLDNKVYPPPSTPQHLPATPLLFTSLTYCQDE